jgi:flagellar basal-body rod protein FlgB
MFDLVSNNYLLQMTDRSMTLASRRMTLIAANIANIDTPNYQAQDFSFESAFKKEMDAMDRQFSPSTSSAPTPSYFSSSAIQSTPSSDSPQPAFERNDLNDVSLDQQTMILSKTQELYQLSSNFAQAELRKVLGAIRDGAK